MRPKNTYIITALVIETIEKMGIRRDFLAKQAGIRQDVLSLILNKKRYVKKNDPRIKKIAKVLGLYPKDCVLCVLETPRL